MHHLLLEVDNNSRMGLKSARPVEIRPVLIESVKFERSTSSEEEHQNVSEEGLGCSLVKHKRQTVRRR